MVGQIFFTNIVIFIFSLIIVSNIDEIKNFISKYNMLRSIAWLWSAVSIISIPSIIIFGIWTK